ncbi:acyl carrier protein [bacterium]|nr:acyl carrier protein [bacterium]
MKNKINVFNEVKSVIIDLFDIDPGMITRDAKLYENLDIDSIDAVDMVIQLQKIVNKKIDPAEFKKVRTVGDIVTAVEKMLKSG